MNSRMKAEGLLFTLFIGVVMAAALWFSRAWPIRASIGILALGAIGVVLAIWQFVLDAKRTDAVQERCSSTCRPAKPNRNGAILKSGGGSSASI